MKIEKKNSYKRLILQTCLCVFVLHHQAISVEGYKNYTVGDSLGWYDSLERANVDYQVWASDKSFSLGDFLIFNTDSNHSVIQTYNLTTYKLCDYADASDNDTIQWSSADPSSTAPEPVSVPVPLVKVGPTYFFSGDYDGEQCQNGQRFSINVTRGQGLPPSLKSPSDDSPAPVSAQAGDDESAPETIVPANFDNPKDDGDEDQSVPSSSSSAVSLMGLYGLSGGDAVVHGLLSFIEFVLVYCL